MPHQKTYISLYYECFKINNYISSFLKLVLKTFVRPSLLFFTFLNQCSEIISVFL